MGNTIASAISLISLIVRFVSWVTGNQNKIKKKSIMYDNV